MRVQGFGFGVRGSWFRVRGSAFPVPGSTFAVRGSGFDDAPLALLRFDEAHPELVEDLFEDLPLFGREIAACFLLEQSEDLDHLRRAVQVRFGALTRHRI